LVALQVVDGNKNDDIVGTKGDGDNIEKACFFQSLEDIEPQPITDISSSVADNESLALFNSELLELLSFSDIDPISVRDSVPLDDKDSADKFNLILPDQIEKQTDNQVGGAQNTTIVKTGVAVDPLPNIEIDFKVDPLLVNSDSIFRTFDSVKEETDSAAVDIGKENGEVNDVNIIALDERECNLENTELLKKSFSFKNNSSSQFDYLPQQDHPNEVELLQEPVIEEFPIDIDLETEELYKELTKMSLNEKIRSFNAFPEESDNGIHATAENAVKTRAGDNNKSVSNNNQRKEKPKVEDKKVTTMDLLLGPNLNNDVPLGSDGLPFLPVCQPCTPEDYDAISNNKNTIFGGSLDGSLPPTISEDKPWEPESGPVERDREQLIQDLRALYMASAAVNPDDLPPLDYSDPLLRVFLAQNEISEQFAQQLRYQEQQEEQLAQQLQYQQQQEAYEKEWKNIRHWANAFGVKLDNINYNDVEERKITPAKDTSKQGFGHKEMIFDVSFSDDGKYVATASQDATIGIWEVATNRLLSSLKGHDKNYECLRVDWANREWAQDILDRSALFANLVASAGADGVVKLWACPDKEDFDKEGRRVIGNEWKCEYTLDHANLQSLGSNDIKRSKEDEDDDKVDSKGDKPQVYSLQFIDHWNIFSEKLREQQCSRHSRQDVDPRNYNNNQKNSFFMTSSDEFIHLWELEYHALDKQLKLDDHKIRILQDKLKLKEVMSLHFGPLDQYSYGVTACSITGTGMRLPPPPARHSKENNDKIAFGGERNPDNRIFVFDAAYCPGSGLLGVALADGSLRLVNGRGSCISVIHLPGNQSHLTSFCWDKSGSRLATCVASGHLVTWSLDAESHQFGNYNTIATCTAIIEGGHQSGRPLFGSCYCGEDENLLLSWGVDGRICMWHSQAQGNIYDPIAVLRNDSGYPIYAIDVSPSGDSVVVGGGGDGGFIGVPVHFYNIPQ